MIQYYSIFLGGHFLTLPGYTEEQLKDLRKEVGRNYVRRIYYMGLERFKTSDDFTWRYYRNVLQWQTGRTALGWGQVKHWPGIRRATVSADNVTFFL